MNVQYLTDEQGRKTAALVPIQQWEDLTVNYSRKGELPQWQKDMIDADLDFIKKHPETLIPGEEFDKVLLMDDEQFAEYYNRRHEKVSVTKFQRTLLMG
jgi:hypothetical protein